MSGRPTERDTNAAGESASNRLPECAFCESQATHRDSIIGRCCDECLAAALAEWKKEAA